METGLSGCVPECEAALASGGTTQACVGCRAASSCAELFPQDGSDSGCEAACNGGGGGPLCETDGECEVAAGEVCDAAVGRCEIPCASDADCVDQLCCAQGDVAACANFCEGDCTFFPDGCPAGQQCYMDAGDATRTLCSVPGARALGEACDNTAGTRAQFCGRELACVRYGAAADAPALCTQLCNVDADCAATAVTCMPLSGPDGLAICPLQ